MRFVNEVYDVQADARNQGITTYHEDKLRHSGSMVK